MIAKKKMKSFCVVALSTMSSLKVISAYTYQKRTSVTFVEYKVGNVTEKAWKKHIELENRARTEKSFRQKFGC